MAAHPQPRLTPEQYLELDRASELRNEYYNGQVYAMSGGTHTHALIIGNIASELGSALRKQPYLVTPAVVRVRVSPEGLYTYPDIAVVCDDPKFIDTRRDTLLNPVLLIEVLSPSTEAYDRGFKSAQYRKIESLQEYALVSQTEARIEVFRRQPEATWLLTESIGLESGCRFDSVDVSVALAGVYSKVSFDLPPVGESENV